MPFRSIPAIPVAAILWLSATGLAAAHDLAASVVRIRALAADGSVNVGSGVVTGRGAVATACHVTRGATTIEIDRDGSRTIADAQFGSPHHDLCVLSAPAIDVAAVAVRASQDLRPGETVVAIGHPNGKGAVASEGRIAALYAYDGGPVVRTSAAFDFGASGGGLFDAAGNLVGILAFKARSGENLRFALPTEWLASASKVAGAFVRITPASQDATFWERSPDERPAFLGVAKREAAAEVR